VIEVMAPYVFSIGYNLNIHNWYSSATLFELLEVNKDVVGTVRLNRKNMLGELNKQKLEN